MTEHADRWSAQIFIEEHDDVTTRARIRLRTRDTELIGTGTARRSPSDPVIPEIGDEIAVSRALSDLAHQLFDASAADLAALAVR